MLIGKVACEILFGVTTGALALSDPLTAIVLFLAFLGHIVFTMKINERAHA